MTLVLGFQSMLKHEKRNGLKQCLKTPQAHSHKCERLEGMEIPTFSIEFTLEGVILLVSLIFGIKVQIPNLVQNFKTLYH